MARSVTDYIKLLKSLMPSGRAWNTDNDSVLYEYLYGCADELSRIDSKWEDLFEERDTRYANELISQHESDFGLPDECTDQASTLSERRSECHTKLLARGGLHKQYYIDLASNYGYDIEITEFTPFWCGLGESGDPCGDQRVIFVWMVTITYTGGALVYFTSGNSVSGDPLIKAGGIDTLVCLLEKYKPAHTYLLYELDGYEYSSAFSIDFDAYPSTVESYLEGAYNGREFSVEFDIRTGGDFFRDEYDSSFMIPI